MIQPLLFAWSITQENTFLFLYIFSVRLADIQLKKSRLHKTIFATATAHFSTSPWFLCIQRFNNFKRLFLAELNSECAIRDDAIIYVTSVASHTLVQ